MLTFYVTNTTPTASQPLAGGPRGVRTVTAYYKGGFNSGTVKIQTAPPGGLEADFADLPGSTKSAAGQIALPISRADQVRAVGSTSGMTVTLTIRE